MKSLRRFLFVPLAAIAVVHVPVLAATVTYQCGMTHYVRNGGAELASTTITVRNSDPIYAATITSLSIRDSQGQLLVEFGVSGNPLPLNTDFPSSSPGGRNISYLPPGGSVYLRSNHIWGNNGLPSGEAGNEVGQSLTATIVISKDGSKNHLTVGTTPRIRERVFNAITATYREGATHSSSNTNCDSYPG